MNERNLRVLEFPKIREMMAALATTDPGRDRCRTLVPSSDPNEVRRMQQETEEASTVLAYNGSNPMAWFTDVRDYLKLAHVGSTLSQKALLAIADVLKASRVVRSALVTDREDTPILTELGSRLSTNRNLEEEIFNAILSEDEISDHASPELYEIRRQMRVLNDRVREKLNAIIRSSTMQKYLMDAIITVRNDRYVVPVKAECRQNVPGIVHDQSGCGIDAVHRTDRRRRSGQRAEAMDAQGAQRNRAHSRRFLRPNRAGCVALRKQPDHSFRGRHDFRARGAGQKYARRSAEAE